ncbi:MAG: hypothetical protein V1720_20475 [bacterium]
MIKKIFSALLVIIGINSCDNSIDPILNSGNELCYFKLFDGKYEVFTNNITGSKPVNISNSSHNDEDGEWSPDGKYIVFKKRLPIGGPIAIVYNIEKKTYTNITEDGGGVSTPPQWTKDGRVYFAYYRPIGSNLATYIMNPDGSNKIKILDSDAAIYFYDDSYTFLYRQFQDTKIYKTNIDNTSNEFIFDSNPSTDEFITIRDFNPIKEVLLVNTNMLEGISSAIAEYSISSKQLNLLIKSEDGYQNVLQRYSKDYKNICFIEQNIKTYDEEYLSIYENGEKRRLVKLTGKEWFDYNPMEFSPDGRYIAFSKNVYRDLLFVYWDPYLHAVDISTGELYYIDEGIAPSWRPR